ncbi:MAG: DUF2214 family protein [Rhizobiaceae bacterium]|nr:DUF2214 family protein [Rhizobiaceae bacterium]
MELADLLLATLHHVLAFGLVGLLCMEMALVKPGLRAADLPRLARIDGAYGAAAALIVLVGIGRVVFGLKGWEYYVANDAFWTKMAAFAAIGLLSIKPTRTILRWRRQPAGDPLADAEIMGLRRWLKAEAALFVVVLACAAAMARGYGS